MQVSTYVAAQMYQLQRMLKSAYQRQLTEKSSAQGGQIVDGISEKKHKMEVSLNPSVGSKMDVMI